MSVKTRNERIASSRLIILLSILLLISITLALLSFFHTARWFEYNDRYSKEVADQEILVQELAKYSFMIRQGDKPSFDALRKSRNELNASFQVLKKGVDADGLPPSPEEVADKFNRAEQSFTALQKLLENIVRSEDAIGQINTLTTTILIQLQKFSNNAKETNPNSVSRKAFLAQRIENNLHRMLEGGEQTKTSLNQLKQDVEALDSLTEEFNVSADKARELIKLVPKIIPALDAIGKISLISETTDTELRNLLNAYREIPGRKIFGIVVGQATVTFFGILAAIFLVLLSNRILHDAKRREGESKALNETNQKAILRLLDEMGDLADGDLTVAATVTEDITGAIADSINYAIEALRNLVTTINQTSEKISGASQESRNTTMHLTEASELQAQQIAQASSAIKDMTIAIDGMARNAKESAEVARKAVDIANKGAGTVRNTIQGMNTIREQIQETSKRIKRLGESSQEIGDIVELIDDIADQTNILALNAAMQAAMAGEAGRGFAVVADEVQRLAERSGNATKQIEALVKTIQADTNEAVASMEVSTAGVVRGARLAEDAGKALGEIEEVSNYIAGLTREIADSALHESQEASKVDEGMSVIQEITTQTAEGTRQTAASVGTLAELAEELQRSVAGFRLPTL